MTAPTGLGQYVKPQGSQGDRVQAQQMVDRPILVWVRKLQHLNRTKFSADGGDAIYIDFIDLQSNQVYIEVMWMAGAIVDGLKQYAGDGNAYPVKVVRVQGGQWGSYQTIESLSEDAYWMNHVQQYLPVFQQLVAQTRAQKEQEWAIAMQQSQQAPPPPPGAPAGPPPPMTPAQVAYNPQAGLHDQAMALQPPHIQQALQQAPPAPAAPAAPPQQFQQPAAAAPAQQFQQAPQQQVPAGPPPQYQQVPGQVQQPPAQPGYQPQQYASPGQPAAPPQQAAVAPPQYGAPAAPAAPPGPPPAAPMQQFQPQAGPSAAPVQQMAPQGLPPAPGAVTGQSVAELQAALNQIG